MATSRVCPRRAGPNGDPGSGTAPAAATPGNRPLLRAPPASRPAARRAGPAGSVSAALTGSAGEAGAAPGPAPSPPGGRGPARAGRAFLRICCTGWGAHWGAAGVGRQFGRIKNWKGCQNRRGKGWLAGSEEGPAWLPGTEAGEGGRQDWKGGPGLLMRRARGGKADWGS